MGGRHVLAICCCHRGELFYTSQVRLNWNFIGLSCLVAFLAMGTAGCGGISASKTVSPLDFFMPGIMKNDAPAGTNAPVASVTIPIEIASVR
jgi:hypothetical protein